MSKWKERLQGLVSIEDGDERLAEAARLDSDFDMEEDYKSRVGDAERERDEAIARANAAEIERDEYRDRYAKMYFTTPEQAIKDQEDDIKRDSKPEGAELLWKFREGY